VAAGTDWVSPRLACIFATETAYVTNMISGTVTPIRTATNTALPPIKTGRSPVAIVITP
jgi:YVTN family beta-propeller protein